MTLPISPYLLPYLTLADHLPERLPDSPEAVVQDLQARIRKLVELVANRDEQIRQLAQRPQRVFVSTQSQSASVFKTKTTPRTVDEIILVEQPHDEDR